LFFSGKKRKDALVYQENMAFPKYVSSCCTIIPRFKTNRTPGRVLVKTFRTALGAAWDANLTAERHIGTQTIDKHATEICSAARQGFLTEVIFRKCLSGSRCRTEKDSAARWECCAGTRTFRCSCSLVERRAKSDRVHPPNRWNNLNINVVYFSRRLPMIVLSCLLSSQRLTALLSQGKV